jgi:hypothetical protein
MSSSLPQSRVRSAALRGLMVTALGFTIGAESVTVRAQARTWSDADLVSGYKDLTARAELDAAIRNPTRPSAPPSPAFLAALAWFAAQTPERSGTLTLADLDRFLDTQVGAYRELLQAKVEKNEDNDYPRTRTWKVVQKLTLLRDEMSRPPSNGRYAFEALPKATSAVDAWDVAHTLSSEQEFVQRVCKAPADRTIVVKFGNTNCTQCMLFELTGAVKSYADAADRRGIDVYKVWFGFRPDSSFAGRIRDPKRLNDLAKAEGATSSPYFVVYRNGRRYPCGDAFPDAGGGEEHLDKCIAGSTAEAPIAPSCGSAGN